MSSDAHVDFITIVVEHEQDVFADAADLLVTVTGASLFSGAEALHKAKEVNALVQALAPIGIDADCVHIEQVRAVVTSGVLTKSSEAVYALRIRVDNLALLAEAIEVLANRKNVSLDEVVWRYRGLEAQWLVWLDQLLVAANAKAQRVAQGLSQKLLGVHRFDEHRADPDRPVAGRRQPGAVYAPTMAKARSSGLAFEMVHSKRVSLTLTVAFRVAPVV